MRDRSKRKREQPHSKPTLHEEKLTSYGICRSLMNNVLAPVNDWLNDPAHRSSCITCNISKCEATTSDVMGASTANLLLSISALQDAVDVYFLARYQWRYTHSHARSEKCSGGGMDECSGNYINLKCVCVHVCVASVVVVQLCYDCRAPPKQI